MDVSETGSDIQFLPRPALLFPALLTYQQTLPLARSHFLDSDRFFRQPQDCPEHGFTLHRGKDYFFVGIKDSNLLSLNISYYTLF